MYRCNSLPPVLPIDGLDFEGHIVYKIGLRCPPPRSGGRASGSILILTARSRPRKKSLLPSDLSGCDARLSLKL